MWYGKSETNSSLNLVSSILMSAHARQLAAQQGLHGLRLPDGQPSPFLHVHADDTTVHASSPADAQAILDGSVALHIDATGAKLQRGKFSGMGIGSLQHLVGPDPATAITFSAAGTSIRHLGIPLSTDPDTVATALYADILQRLQARIARWSGFRLSLLGRAHVAKQVLVAMFTYHGTFIPVPEQLLRQLCTSVYTFVAANRPVVAGATSLAAETAAPAHTAPARRPGSLSHQGGTRPLRGRSLDASVSSLPRSGASQMRTAAGPSSTSSARAAAGRAHATAATEGCAA